MARKPEYRPAPQQLTQRIFDDIYATWDQPVTALPAPAHRHGPTPKTQSNKTRLAIGPPGSADDRRSPPRRQGRPDTVLLQRADLSDGRDDRIELASRYGNVTIAATVSSTA